jgi:hypothetical protein
MLIQIVKKSHCFAVLYFSTDFDLSLLLILILLSKSILRLLSLALKLLFIMLISPLTLPWHKLTLLSLVRTSLILNWIALLSPLKATSVLVMGSQTLVLIFPSKTELSAFSLLTLILTQLNSFVTENALVSFVAPALSIKSARKLSHYKIHKI